ncbi:hypothetical protein LMH73_018180 [Vibrio splendidus]|nr:helix-turn-helix transcriptional regulator [Vibrio splendidus]MCC4882943.1 helix-turn-helix domain-containing protein [Vibrio splendidus]
MNKLIESALTILGCNQKELAQKLNVSQTQISKWKSDEYMSEHYCNELKGLIGIGETEIDLFLQVKCPVVALELKVIIDSIVVAADENSASPYSVEAHSDYQSGMLSSKIIIAIQEMGVKISTPLNDEISAIHTLLVNGAQDEDAFDSYLEKIDSQRYFYFISKAAENFANLCAFHTAYVYDLDNVLIGLEEEVWSVESKLLKLAVALACDDLELTYYTMSKQAIQKELRKELLLLNYEADIKGIALPIDLLLLANTDDTELLCRLAEKQAYNFNNKNITPASTKVEKVEVDINRVASLITDMCDQLGITPQSLCLGLAKN